MPEKSRTRTLVDTQHVKQSEKLHKPSRQYFSHIFWSLWKKIRRKNSFLVVSEILRLFVNILSPYDKYSFSVKASVLWNQFKCYYLKIKKHFWIFFLDFRNLHQISNSLEKRWASEFFCFWNYRLQNAGLLKCPKSRVAEHFWRVNMLEGPKHCINLHGNMFVIFFDHSETKSYPIILF